MDNKEAAIEAGAEAREYTQKRTRRMLKKSLDRIKEALDAETIKVFSNNGDIVESSPYVDHSTRLKAAEIVVSLCDAKPAERHEVNITGNLSDRIKDARERAKKRS